MLFKASTMATQPVLILDQLGIPVVTITKCLGILVDNKTHTVTNYILVTELVVARRIDFGSYSWVVSW